MASPRQVNVPRRRTIDRVAIRIVRALHNVEQDRRLRRAADPTPAAVYQLVGWLVAQNHHVVDLDSNVAEDMLEAAALALPVPWVGQTLGQTECRSSPEWDRVATVAVEIAREIQQGISQLPPRLQPLRRVS
jgi:hypothetical protein